MWVRTWCLWRCTVLFDGGAMQSCLMLAVRATSSFVTVEGSRRPRSLRPLQEAFQPRARASVQFLHARYF